MKQKSKNGGITMRVDDDLMETLAEQRQGFETPAQCMKRLISQRLCNPNETTAKEDTIDKDENEEEIQ